MAGADRCGTIFSPTKGRLVPAVVRVNSTNTESLKDTRASLNGHGTIDMDLVNDKGSNKTILKLSRLVDGDQDFISNLIISVTALPILGEIVVVNKGLALVSNEIEIS